MAIKMKSGKMYLTVVERMNLLLEEKGREDYSLETEVTYESGVVIVKAILTLFYCYPKDETKTVEVVSRKYVGHALGELGKAKTLEATETHAIGRCLAAAGWFGSEFASANEMEAYEKQSKSKPEPKQTMKVDNNLNVAIETVKEKFDGAVMKNLVNFGKHNGKDWSEVPEDYINWVCKNSKVDWQRSAAQQELDRRNGSNPTENVIDELVNEFEGMPS
tara:strand:+ start:214 stop:870 length:657 start_codon:yes stop_codon:yes gene_type:complete